MTIRVTQPEREEMLRLRMERGLNNAQIAEVIHRTIYSVTDSIGPTNNTSETAKWRKCLNCRKRFLSIWAGNRRCGMCLKVAQGMSSSLEP